MTFDKHQTEAGVAADFVTKHLPGRVETLNHPDPAVKATATIAELGEGRRFEDITGILDRYAERPRRAKGFTRFATIESLIDFANRHPAPETGVIAASYDPPKIKAILNAHKTGALPHHGGDLGYGDFGASFEFPLSDEWKAWSNADGEPMDQYTFSAFLEDRVTDLQAPPNPEFEKDRSWIDLGARMRRGYGDPLTLLSAARNLRIESQEVQETVHDPQNGSIRVLIDDTKQKTNIEVPGLALIAIPVVKFGTMYRMAVQINYRKNRGAVQWTVRRWQPEQILRMVVKDAAELTQSLTKLPLFWME